MRATGGPQQARSLPDSSATASLHLQGARQAAQVQPRDTTEGGCGSQTVEPLSQGKGRGGDGWRRGLNSSLQTWCLEILSQESRIHLCRHNKREGRSESPSKNIHPALAPLTASQRRLQGGGKYTHTSLCKLYFKCETHEYESFLASG